MPCPYDEFMSVVDSHQHFMSAALAEAKKAYESNEVPIGAVMVRNQDKAIVAKAHNTRETSSNPLHHAEILVLEQTAKLIGDWRLNDFTLYVTIEPCPMCLGALLQARVGRLVFGASDPKRNFESQPQSETSLLKCPTLENIQTVEGNNHQLQVEGQVLENEARELIQRYFQEKRKK